MESTRILFSVFVLVVILNSSVGFLFPSSYLKTGVEAAQKAPRWNMPWLGLGMWCNGCPPRSCEDDEAIIHGYCCGCAKPLDKLPVLCPEFLQCPLNLQGLCHDYEYMLRCCC